MRAHASAVSPRALKLVTALLLASHTFFLWMFFAAESVPEMVRHGCVSASPGEDLVMTASRFAAQWKHGMAGNSPLYMPGFFPVGFLVWLWSIGRPLRALAVEFGVLVVVATILAAALAPLGAPHAVRAFEQATGLACSGPVLPFTPVGAALSVYTLFTWTVDIVSLQLCIARCTLLPVAAPIVLNVIMLEVRPWAVNDFTTQWIADLSRWQPVAVWSVAVVPLLVWLLIWLQLRLQRLGRARGSTVECRFDAHLS